MHPQTDRAIFDNPIQLPIVNLYFDLNCTVTVGTVAMFHCLAFIP